MAMLGFESCSEFVIYVTFLFFGLSVMVVSNSITAAPGFITEYYRYASGDPEMVSSDPQFWNNVLTYYNVAVFGMQTVCEIFMLTPLGRSIPLRPRLIVGLAIPFAEILALILVPVGKTNEAGAKATIMIIAIVGAVSKTLCNSTTGALAGPFPTKFFTCVLLGQGVSGIVSSAMSIIIKASMADDFDSVLTQSRIYFGIAMGLQLVSCILLILMPRNPFARKYTAEFRYRHLQRKNANEATGSHGNEPPVGTIQEDATEEPKPKSDSCEPAEEDGEMRAIQDVPQNVLTAEGDADMKKDVDQVDNITSTEQMLNAQIKTVFLTVWPMLLACFVVFGATLLLFPGVFFAVGVHDDWYITIIVAMFNLGDFSARILLLFKRLQVPPKVVLAGSFLRLLVVPPLVFCVRGNIPGVALPYILCLIWGLTNGYFGGLGMIYGPRAPSLKTAGERSLAAMMAGVCLLLGLFVGSSIAIGVAKGLPNQ